ncbi:FmdB family zinc ribbon protein [Planctomycetota bacterium]
MPTYEYLCENCRAEFERFQTITAKPLRVCPECGEKQLKRLIGTGGGIIFKGSGFYQTDYRSDGYKQAAQNEKQVTEQTSGEKDSKTKDSKSPDKPKSQDKKTA